MRDLVDMLQNEDSHFFGPWIWIRLKKVMRYPQSNAPTCPTCGNWWSLIYQIYIDLSCPSIQCQQPLKRSHGLLWGVTRIHFLRLIPTLKHYSDIVSDIPSGSVYIYIHIYIHTCMRHIYSGILSGIYFDILSDILFYILFGHLFRHSFWHSFWRLAAWGPAVPAGIWRSRLRPGSAHWSLEFGLEDEEEKRRWESLR